MPEIKSLEHQRRELANEMNKLRKAEFQKSALILAVSLLSSIAGAVIALTSISKEIDITVLKFLTESDTARVIVAAVLGGLAGVIGYKGVFERLRRSRKEEHNGDEEGI